MTVEELVKQKNPEKVWLCPNIVDHKNAFEKHSELLQGIECARFNVPDELRGKEVVKCFKEAGFLCIIWKNV